MPVMISTTLWLVVAAVCCCLLPTARAETGPDASSDLFSLMQTLLLQQQQHHQQQQTLLQKIEAMTNQQAAMAQQLTLLQEEVSDCKCKEKADSENAVNDTRKPVDCSEVSRNGDGIYEIFPDEAYEGTRVLCDQTFNGGGWTVIQQRLDGSVDFYRPWREYEDGFGDMGREFWLGNAVISQISGQKDYMLRVELEDFEGERRHAEYDFFRVDGPYRKYKLHVGSYSGTAGDSLTYHGNSDFSTYDVDNDNYEQSCSQRFKGAWWYNSCHLANLNGRYLGGVHSSFADGVNWKAWRGHYYSMKMARMMIRPKDF